jgi:hypothetical protein
MREVVNNFSNDYEALAFLKKPQGAFDGKTAADLILDNRNSDLYTFLESGDFDS